MFKKKMLSDIEKIFGMEATFNVPSDAFEQDKIFILVGEVKTKPGVKTISAKVTGSLVVFSQNEKLTYGFFNKKIEQAEAGLVKPFYFYNVDTEALNSPARLQNISERRCDFMYLYDAQYDPEQGSLTSLKLTEVELEGV